MGDTACMRIGKRVDHRQHPRRHLIGGLADEAREPLAIDELPREKAQGLITMEVEHPGDVRVRQPARLSAGFSQRIVSNPRRGEARRENPQEHGLAKLFIFGQPASTDAVRSQNPNQAKAAE
jgi:hypothetical protein